VSARILRALITGASSGIGEEFARQLADRGVELVLVARRRARLERLAGELSVRCQILPADLTSAEGLARVEGRLRDEADAVDLLVNNAGFGAYGRFEDLPPDRQLQMVHLNVTALVRLTHAALTQLCARDVGGVINVGSTAGFQPDPYAAVYGGTKAFARSFTEALHEELRGTGVRAMVLAPGVTDTEFQDVASVHLDPVSRRVATGPGPVVEQALRDFARDRASSVPGLVNLIGAWGADVTPSIVSRRLSAVVHRAFAGDR
jgi:uncharacterized protein